MVKIFQLILFTILGLFSAVSFGCSSPNSQVIEKKFDELEANKKKLFYKNISYEAIELITQNNESIVNYAKKCLEDAEAKIKNLSHITKELKTIQLQPSIQQKLINYEEQLCQHKTKKVLCESLKIEANEANALSIDSLKKYRFDFRKPNLLESINLASQNQIKFVHVENMKAFLNLDSFTDQQLKALKKAFFIGLMIALIVFSLLRFVRKKVRHHLFNGLLRLIQYYFLFLLPIVVVLVRAKDFLAQINQKPAIINCLVFLQLVIKVLLFLQILFFLIKENRSQTLFEIFRKRMNSLCFWAMCQYGAYDFIRGYFLNENTVNYITQLIIFLFTPILFWLGYRTLKSWINFYYNNLSTISIHFYKKIYILILVLLCVIQILLSISGYSELAYHFPAVFAIVILLFLFLKRISFVLNKIQLKLEKSNSTWSKNLNQTLGKGTNVFLLEFRILFHFIVIFFTLFLFKRVFQGWGLPLVFISYMEQLIFQGFLIANYRIQPYFLIQVALVVLFINAIGKIIAKIWISNSRIEEDKKFTINMLVNSAIYLLSFIVALEMLGVEPAQVSFMIGAFSVGVGFALRGILSDFMAGIYLIFSKPVYIGDYIEINGVEGQIKKISLLSTELATPSQTVVYVPNERFIRNNLFNKSKLKKIITCELDFLIKNFNDFDLSRSVILEVTSKYPDVYQKEGLQPQLLFNQVTGKQVSGYSLKLTLHISNIEQKDAILASIQLETLRLFQERGVEII